MAKFLDRVRNYSYLDEKTGECGRTGNFTYLEDAEITDPIYLELTLTPGQNLDITAYKTNIADTCPHASGGYEVYQHVANSGWDIDLKKPIGSASVVSRVNKTILDNLSVEPEYEDSSLKELLLKTTECVGHYLGWDNLYIASDIVGERKHKPTVIEKAKSTFEHIKDMLMGREEVSNEAETRDTYDILVDLGYTEVNPDPTSTEIGPMVGSPQRRSLLQPDILETLCGKKLNGSPITKDDNFSPRFQFSYRILDKDFNDLISSHGLHY